MPAAALLPRQRSETFHWRFQSPASRIWPVLADTERFNEAASLPRYTLEETPRPDGGVEHIGRAKVAGFDLAWREVPGNWVSDKWFEHRREFLNGPLTSMTVTLRLFPEGSGSRAEYTLEAEARTLAGRLILAGGFFSSTRKKFAKMARDADLFARGDAKLEFDYPAPVLQPGAEAKLAAGMRAVEASAYGHGLAERLAGYIAERPEVDVRKIRPLALAARWGVEAREAVETCLQAVRSEILGLRWDLLCPRCQVAKAASPSLDRLPETAHCASCNIDYGRDYARNVELAFFPARSIRRIDEREFCLFGPMSTPHICLQITVPAGESRSVPAVLVPGAYRLRTLEAGGEAEIDWRSGGFPEAVADGSAERGTIVRGGAPAEAGVVVFHNRTDVERVFVVEELAWRRDALTADRATALQAFRDLFDQEILRPGDHLEIDHVSFMFTDLKGSTALYEQVGDAQAYFLVRSFFAVLAAAIRAENGAVVKTIGDAVHAAFASPADALACAVRIQADIEAFNRRSGKAPIGVKIGLHAGRSIAVTLNERLDYYGTAVNRAARLCDQSRGGDVVMSESFAAEPAASAALAGCALSRESAVMKGFGAPVAFVRLTLATEEVEAASG